VFSFRRSWTSNNNVLTSKPGRDDKVFFTDATYVLVCS